MALVEKRYLERVVSKGNGSYVIIVSCSKGYVLINKIVLLFIVSGALVACSDSLPEWSEFNNITIRHSVADDEVCGSLAASLISRNDSYLEDATYYFSRAFSKIAYQSCDIGIQTSSTLNCIFRNNIAKSNGDTHLISDCPDSGLDDKEMKKCTGKRNVYSDKYIDPLIKLRFAPLERKQSLLSKEEYLDVLEVEYAESCGHENL
jgi:hypothetical protein